MTDADVWAITSYRAGETSQILGLAESLERPYREVRLDYRRRAGPLGLLRAVAATGVATPLAPPWPRLVLSAGLRNEPVCRWLRVRSGGRTRLVFIGRTWAPVGSFDLVVTTPQYRLRPAPNVLENPLTLHGHDHGALQAARVRWDRPLGAAGQRIGVLIGGATGPYQLDEACALQLAGQLNTLRREAGGNVRFLISSSSRTPPAFLGQLEGGLEGDHFVYRWRAGAADNPYAGILACADALVVTEDSVAMLSEAVAAGVPVLVAELSVRGRARLRARAYRVVMRWGHRRWTRDVGLVHEVLYQRGLARPLSDGAAALDQAPASVDDYQKETARRVVELLA